MKFKKQAAQGDLLITKIDSLPEDAISKKCPPKNGKHIVAHSETGHHHTLAAAGVTMYAMHALLAYLVIERETELVHERDFDTHDPITLGEGIYEIRRQREYIPEGWRRVAD